MTRAIFSPAWYRVADLKIRLRRHTVVHRHVYRGQIWFVLQDRVSGQFHRFTPEAYEIIGRMDGRWTLQDIWQAACGKLGDLMPTQQDVIQLVAQLHQANAIQGDRNADTGELYRRRRRLQRNKLMQKLSSPLGVRIPLFDPEAFLRATSRFVTPVFSAPGMIAWLTVVATAVALAVVHWDQISRNVADRALALENVLLMALVYPVVKTIHELGHAYAVKRWGGEVHEIGLMFLIFYPVPYTDASAATAFRDKGQRMIVGAAGIMVELVLASVALFVWLSVEPGLVRAIAANVILLAGVSGVLFNGNPLLRFDAYYVLADWVETPNLGQKSQEQLAYLAKRWLFGIRRAVSPAWSAGEGVGLASYAILSFVYRVFVLFAVTLLVSTQYRFAGGIIAAWSIFVTLVSPMMRAIKAPLYDGHLRPMRRRIFSISMLIFLAIAGLIFAVPAPFSIRAQGLVWVEDKAVLRAADTGVVEQVVAAPDTAVGVGEVLLRLDNPVTANEVKTLTAELGQARDKARAAFDNPSQALIADGAVRLLEHQLAVARARAQDLVIRSPVSGAFLLPDANDLVGRFVHRGERIGFVANPQRMLVAVLVPEDNIDEIRGGGTKVYLRFASNLGQEVEGQILRTYPSSDNVLPSAVLATQGGGPFAPDPSGHDPLTAYRRFYRIDVAVPQANRHPVEERAHILFRRRWEPIGFRWWRAARRLVLGRFDV